MSIIVDAPSFLRRMHEYAERRGDKTVTDNSENPREPDVCAFFKQIREWVESWEKGTMGAATPTPDQIQQILAGGEQVYVSPEDLDLFPLYSRRCDVIKEKPQTLFVYGTLRPDMRESFGMSDFDWEHGTVVGELYSINGAYPGFRPSNKGKNVKGCAVHIPGEDWNDTIARLDLYEGCPRLYTRERVMFRPKDGEKSMKEVWIYVFNAATSFYPLIASGDWEMFAETRERTAPYRNVGAAE